MRIALPTRHAPSGHRTLRPGVLRGRGRRGLTAALATAAAAGTLALAGATPASASTLNGIATIANPASLAPVTSGGSTTTFTVSLPSVAACDGDTATNGYHVYSYLVPQGTALSGVTFESFPSVGFGLVDNAGTYYGPVNTAIGTGQIVTIPNDFQWGPLVSDDGVPLSQLLYTGSGSTASGVWEAGLACANTHGALADNWNTQVTFNASSSDPNGFTWTAVPGPSGSAPAAFTSAATTTFTEGAASSFTPTASGSPTPTITESGTLPAGVTFTSGALTGTPTVTGTFPITLTAHNGILGNATQSFSLVVVTPAPVVTGVSPAAGPDAGGTSVVISGTSLSGASAVDFGSTPATITADSATSVTATAPAGSGSVDVTVTTPGGTSQATASDLFTYAAVPVVTGVAPEVGPPDGGTSVVISGTGLGAATTVDFGANPATITSDTSTSITATSPGGSGAVDVTVTTAGGTSATSPADLFTYGSAPAVSGVSPTAGPTTGGTSVTIAGNNLGGATAVDFGSTPATITGDTASSITATAPAGTGTVDVTVTTANGTSATSAADQFTYVAAPVVTGISPTTGSPTGGTSVTITGSDLSGATVAFGSAAATVTADSATSVTATAPAGTGTVDVTVTTAGGTSATSAADQFTYGTAPVFTSGNSTTFVVGTAGTFTPVATGNPTPVVTESGTLPAGVTFAGGVLSGTPTTAGTSSITFTATNGVGAPVTQAFTLTVDSIEITTTSLPDAQVGVAYSATLAATGGVQPYKWKITSGALPKGIKLKASTGVISGTVKSSVKHPPATGPFTVTVSVTDHTKHVKLTTSTTLTLTLVP